MDIGNVDIVAVAESQQFSDYSADSASLPLHQSLTVSGCWCRDRSRVHFDIDFTLMPKVGAAVSTSAAPPLRRRLDE